MPVLICVWPPIPDTICTLVFVHDRYISRTVFGDLILTSPFSILMVLQSQEAQEGSWGGCDQEEDSPCPEVPACCCWSYPAGKWPFSTYFRQIRLNFQQLLPRTSWQRGTRSLKCERHRGSRLSAPPRIRRRPPSRSLSSRWDSSTQCEKCWIPGNIGQFGIFFSFIDVPLFFNVKKCLLFPGQGCAEGTEGNKECPEGRSRQGRWQEINILPSNSCGNLFNKWLPCLLTFLILESKQVTCRGGKGGDCGKGEKSSQPKTGLFGNVSQILVIPWTKHPKKNWETALWGKGKAFLKKC